MAGDAADAAKEMAIDAKVEAGYAFDSTKETAEKKVDEVKKENGGGLAGLV